ncbi:hypothetical protein BDU57DRAFT_509458 [Ampelomyces quisqualis]|uniref:Uncharacterized protein n=1 Tax=Ampelomyces quisqualis TaxID=50730 RepID=A0A6A5R1D1_AMPQU|nr:hypothetical protein BDU57DRAFT_509458 [Ampelomyces quisqualis]
MSKERGGASHPKHSSTSQAIKSYYSPSSRRTSILHLNPNRTAPLPHPPVHKSITPSLRNKHTSKIMSAPNAGRQSPEPEKQTEAQAGSTSTNTNDQGGGVSGGSEQSSDKTKGGLASNPEHPLAKHAEETTSKK